MYHNCFQNQPTLPLGRTTFLWPYLVQVIAVEFLSLSLASIQPRAAPYLHIRSYLARSVPVRIILPRYDAAPKFCTFHKRGLLCLPPMEYMIQNLQRHKRVSIDLSISEGVTLIVSFFYIIFLTPLNALPTYARNLDLSLESPDKVQAVQVVRLILNAVIQP